MLAPVVEVSTAEYQIGVCIVPAAGGAGLLQCRLHLREIEQFDAPDYQGCAVLRHQSLNLGGQSQVAGQAAMIGVAIVAMSAAIGGGWRELSGPEMGISLKRTAWPPSKQRASQGTGLHPGPWHSASVIHRHRRWWLRRRAIHP